MILVKQNNPELHEDIQKIGCCFITLIDIAQIKAEKNLTTAQINKIWTWAKETHRINEENNVTDNASIINRAYTELGKSDGRFYEIGTFKDGKLTYYPCVAPEYRLPCFWMQKIKQSGPSKTHFRLVDKYGDVIEDPHDPPIASKGVIHTVLFNFI